MSWGPVNIHTCLSEIQFNFDIRHNLKQKEAQSTYMTNKQNGYTSTSLFVDSVHKLTRSNPPVEFMYLVFTHHARSDLP